MSVLNSQNTICWLNKSVADHKTQVDKWAALGFRTSSLSIYGDPAKPTFAAVMVKRQTVIAERQLFPLNHDQYVAEFNTMAAQKMGPYLVAATGPASNPTFALCFRPMDPTPFTRANMTLDGFVQRNAERQALGEILLSLDAYGTPDNPLFIAVWVPNPDRTAWSIASWDPAAGKQVIAQDDTFLQQRFNALTQSGAHQAQVAILPSGKMMALYVDSSLSPLDNRGRLSAEALQTIYNADVKAGLQPLQITGQSFLGTPQFSAILGSHDDVEPDKPRRQGPTSIDAIDQVMRDYMKAANLRGAALAIIKDTRLVYASGYTNAPASYPDVTPQTLFRQASVSKVFTAVTMWRLLQEGHYFTDNTLITLNTPLQKIMKLKQPDGSLATDGWEKITLQHLIESDSAIPQWLIYASTNAASACKGKLPASIQQLLSYATSQKLTGTPGDPNNSFYGNFDYLLLSQAVAAIHGSDTFAKALKALVLDPLGMSHTRMCASTYAGQGPGEARYHLRVYNPANDWPLYPLEVLPTVRDPSGTLVASQYGAQDFEVFTGAGGISSSVVDVARLAAMLSIRVAGPVLSPETTRNMMQACADAGAKMRSKGSDGKNVDKDGKPIYSHGFHGFDWAQLRDPYNGIYSAAKGGWLPGTQTSVSLTTWGFGYVLAINGNEDGTFDWLSPIKAIAEKPDWGNTDLFVSEYKLPSLALDYLGTSKSSAPKATPMQPMAQTTLPMAQTMRQVAKSMASSWSARGR